MVYEYGNSFIKDSKKLPKEVKLQIQRLIETVRITDQFSQISNVKKMKGYSNAYRIRLGEYRVGVLLENDTLVFVRILHRKEVYRYFP